MRCVLNQGAPAARAVGSPRAGAVRVLLPVSMRALLLCAAAALLLAPPACDAQEIEASDEKIATRTDAATDRRIAERLSATFESLEPLAAVKVEVRSGVVRLSGEVPSLPDRALAGTLAKQVEGVVAVQNDLQESLALDSRLGAVVDDLEARAGRLLLLLPLIAVSILVLAAFVLAARLVGRAKRPFSWMTANVFLRDLLRQVARAAVVLMGVLLALEIVGATTLVGAVLGTAGVVGLAIGFAFRDLVENYIASVLLSLRRPFSPSDHVRIEGHEGKVVRLTSRATLLLGFDGNHIRIPNATVFKSTIVNFSRKPERRLDFAVGVASEPDPASAQRVAADALRGLDGILTDPEPLALVETLGDSNVVIRVLAWIDQTRSDWGRMRSEAIRRVKLAFEEAGLEMPEPISRVRLENTGAVASRPGPALPASEAGAPVGTAPERHLDQEIQAERAGEEPDLLASEGEVE